MKLLYPFQTEAVIAMDHNFLLADDCSLGKTVVSIRAALLHGVTRPILVLTRKAAKHFWKQECVEEGFAPDKVHISREAGRDLPLPLLPNEYGSVYITHHEALLYVGKALAQEQWGLVIVDEAHRFRYKTRRTDALMRIRAPMKFALTATPYGKNPSDMWAILHWLYPNVFTSFWRFYNKYVDYFTPYGTKFRIVRGGMHLDVLAEQLAPFYLARKKRDVLSDLPEELPPAEVPVMFAPAQEALYADLLRTSYMYLEESHQEIIFDNALVRMLRLHQIATDPGMFVLAWKEQPAKVGWLVEWLEDNTEQPVILACRYRKFIDRWLHALKWPTIVGGMKDTDIQEALCRFTDTGRLVGTIGAISEGLNLQRANIIIIPDGTGSPTALYQMSQRIHRIGQTMPTQVYHLLGTRRNERHTVDRTLLHLAQRRLTEAEMLDAFVEEVRRG